MSKRPPQRRKLPICPRSYLHVAVLYVSPSAWDSNHLFALVELAIGWRSHDVGRIGHVQARDELAQFAQVVMGEQQVLARGLHVAEGPQQAAPTVSGGAAAKLVRGGRHLHAGVAGVHASHADASLE